MNEIALEVKNISKRYRLLESRKDSLKETIVAFFSRDKTPVNNFQALTNLSFELHKGESLGIIGKNGAGKSTLLKILSGISQPDEGEINFYGKTVSILDIGAGFHPDLSGRENIYLAASLYNFPRKEIEQRLKEIIDFSGVERFIEEPVKNYSAGMYLRLAFSIITCLEADIYLIDEVIQVGDANFQMKCKTKIEELISKGKTLLIASHNLNEIAVLCNRVILMEDGRIADAGDSDVIQKYLTTALPELFRFTGSEFFHLKDMDQVASSAKQVAIIGFGLLDYKVLPDGISNKQAFRIFVEINLLKPVSIDLALKIYDSPGILVFVTGTMQKKLPEINEVGRYRVIFSIPGDLLNQRLYSVDLTIINKETKGLLDKIEKMVTMKIAGDKGLEEYKSDVVLAGVVKPLVLITIDQYK